MPTHFFRSTPLPTVGRAVALIYVTRADEIRLHGCSFYARSEREIEDVRIGVPSDRVTQAGQLVDGVLDELTYRLMGVVMEEMDGPVLEACLPLQLEEVPEWKVRSTRLCNDVAGAHLDRIAERIEDTRNPS